MALIAAYAFESVFIVGMSAAVAKAADKKNSKMLIAFGCASVFLWIACVGWFLLTQ